MSLLFDSASIAFDSSPDSFGIPEHGPKIRPPITFHLLALIAIAGAFIGALLTVVRGATFFHAIGTGTRLSSALPHRLNRAIAIVLAASIALYFSVLVAFELWMLATNHLYG